MMTPLFRVVLVVVSVGTLAEVLSKIRKSKLDIEDSIFWILMAIMFVVFAIFPIVPDTLARLLGIYSTANFLFLFMIFILLMRLFTMSMRVSTLEDRVKKLVQELALRDKRAVDEKEINSKDEKEIKNIDEGNCDMKVSLGSVDMQPSDDGKYESLDVEARPVDVTPRTGGSDA